MGGIRNQRSLGVYHSIALILEQVVDCDFTTINMALSSLSVL